MPCSRPGSRPRGWLARGAVVMAWLGVTTGPLVYARTPDELCARFREAYFAAATGAEIGDERDDDALRAYPLYPYLQAERIAKTLSLIDDADANSSDEAAEEFLNRHAGEPVADVLERAWLESLARRGLDGLLIERYRPEIATPRLECQWLAARVDTGDLDGLEQAALERWLTPAQLPIDCEPVFEWLRARGALDAEWTERRLRLLLENGEAAFARVIARRLPPETAAPWLSWADLIESPLAALDALIAMPERAVAFDALLDGFSRLAVEAPDAAVARLAALLDGRALDSGEAVLIRRALAYGLAWDRDPRALDYFAQIDGPALDDYTLEWRARSALWAGDWPLVAASIETLSAASRNEPAWRYWAARAAQALGDESRAGALYESLLPDDNFYSALAAARLERTVVPHAERLSTDKDTVKSLERLEPLLRARELRAVDLPEEALAEWRFAQSRLDPDAQLESIDVAVDWGWYDVAIATATSKNLFFDYELLYPRPYAKSVAAAARLTHLDTPLIFGVIRQESLFRPDAATSAGAVGLMQIVPETARRTAADWHRPRPTRDDLFEPETNITLGAAHLRDLVDRFDGDLPVALAAYNAGPAVVRGWLPDEPLDTDIWIENIPYNETRAYVRHVLWHSLVFAWLTDHDPQDTGSWLGQIAPLNEDEK